MIKKIGTQSSMAALAVLLAITTCSGVFAQNSDHPAQIRSLIAKTYDKPDHKVETAPIVVANDYALADWIQGEKGGRALLRRNNGQWEIIACGGDGFKDIKFLKDAGIPTDTATHLVAQLNTAEQSVSPERVKRFGLFGTSNDPRLADHHHTHTKP